MYQSPSLCFLALFKRATCQTLLFFLTGLNIHSNRLTLEVLYLYLVPDLAFTNKWKHPSTYLSLITCTLCPLSHTVCHMTTACHFDTVNKTNDERVCIPFNVASILPRGVLGNRPDQPIGAQQTWLSPSGEDPEPIQGLFYALFGYLFDEIELLCFHVDIVRQL